MNIGQLRDRVTIEQLSETEDGLGGLPSTPTTVATVWANVNRPVGRERFTSGLQVAELDYVVTIRHRAGIKAKTMRLKLSDGTLVDIESVLPDGRRHWLVLVGRERI